MESVPDYSSASLLQTKRYVLFWISSLLSNIGTWMQQVAQPWVILSISQSAFWVGLDSFAMNAPGWVFTLWGGVLADRFDRKKIILFCQSIQFTCVLFLLLFLVYGKIQIWMILLSSFLVGTTDALSMPAFQSIIPSLVSEQDIPRAIALNSTQFNLSRILGPALAGLVIAAYGATVCYTANLISYIPFFLSLYWIYPRRGFKKDSLYSPHSTSVMMVEFIEILKNRKFSIPLAVVLVTSFFCSPLVTFCPVLVKDFLKGSVDQLGWSMAAFGGGGVVGALGSSFLSVKITGSRIYSHGLAILVGAILILTMMTHSLWTFDLMLVLSGITLTMSNTSVNSLLQRSAPNHFRGRVVSLFQLSLHGGISLGSLSAGALSSYWSVRSVLLIYGILAVCSQLFLLFVGSSKSSRKKADSSDRPPKPALE